MDKIMYYIKLIVTRPSLVVIGRGIPSKPAQRGLSVVCNWFRIH